MNKIYRLVWNHTLGMVQVAAEWAKAPRGGMLCTRTVGSAPQRSRLAQACAAALLLSVAASALPAHAGTYVVTAASDSGNTSATGTLTLADNGMGLIDGTAPVASGSSVYGSNGSAGGVFSIYSITGGQGTAGSQGGTGISGDWWTLNNNGAIAGGHGGDGGPFLDGTGGVGGNGGAAIDGNEWSFSNSDTGSTVGGNGGNGGNGGDRGSAIPLDGTGGVGGNGGAGIVGNEWTLDNSGSIIGGNGGNGGNGYSNYASGTGGIGGNGGTGIAGDGSSLNNSDGSIVGGNGGNGGNGYSNYASGTGGIGGNGGTGIAGDVSSLNNSDGAIVGGNGGQGGFGYSRSASGIGGAGGNGGAGIAGNGSNLDNAGGSIAGGSGGQGGRGYSNSASGIGGAGGNGGAGITGSGFTLDHTGTIEGGGGGAGGGAAGVGRAGGVGGIGGNGGNGGAGITGSGFILGNTGDVTGGGGGTGGTGGTAGADGVGGVGLVATGQASITNAGSIAGGVAADTAATQADAVNLSAGGNTLTLENGYTFTGNVISSSGDTAGGDTLALGGDSSVTGGTGDGSFEVSAIVTSVAPSYSAPQYHGFKTYEKTGSSTWTLTNSTPAVTPWTVTAGTLSVASDGNLGDPSGAMTLNGGTLQSTAAFTMSRDLALSTSGGTLQTDADLGVSGVVSGAGTLNKLGAGSLTLDGASTDYSGLVQVQQGRLIVGSAAGNGAVLGGEATVASGATLGGHGTLGGNVKIDNGGHLAPGNSIGKLTINGNLLAAQGSVLDYEFGTPGVSVQTFGSGDSVQVGGNLELDGTTLNVTDVGGMGPGVYNVFSYAGNLRESNGGVTLGSTPSGAVLQLQILTGDKQINLLDTTGLTLNFWNANHQASATQMGGGDGSWSRTAENWTDANGSVTAAMQPQPGFAVFGGTPGTVTVDDSAGSVTATGMQFMVDGYQLSGDTLALVADSAGAAPVLRVGNGSGIGISATIGNVLAGADGLVKTDSGTLTLSGANTYSGGTSITGGTLSVANDGNLGDPGGAITLNGGTLQVTGSTFTTTTRVITLGDAGGGFDIADASNHFSVAQDLTGAGALSKLGAGRLTLTGANAYSGGTRITGGTLSVSSDDNLGDSGGAITLNGGTLQNTAAFTMSRALVLNASGGSVQTDADLGVSGVVSGAGTLTKTGTTTLTLTGANTYSGGTTITAGTVQVGDGGTHGSIVGDVTNNGTLAFDRSDSVVFSDVINGSGALRQQGTGSLVLNGVNSYSGPTTVSSGRLQVGDAGHPDASVGSDVTVTGGTLGGHGTIAGNVDNVGGTVMPGGSIGILTMTGDYTQSAAGTLAVEVTPTPTAGTGYSQLQVGGTANLDGTLAVAVDPGSYLSNTSYDLVHAQGGVNGTFAASMFNPAFAPYLSPRVSYRANDVLLTLHPNALAYSNGFPNSASSVVLGMEQSFDAVLGQLRDDGEGRNGVWGQYLASRGGMGQGSRYANHGGAAGVGMSVGDQVVLGAALSGGTTLTTLTPTQVRVQPLGGFVYGVWHADSLRVAGSFGVGHLQQRIRRYLGDLGTVQQANSDGRYNGFALRADYTAKLGAINLSPYAGVDYTNSHYDAAQEQGLPLLALHYDKISQHVSHYQAGLRLSTSSRTWRPWVQVGMEGWGGDRTTTVTERLGDYSRQVSSSALPGSALSGGAGMNWHAGNWDTTLSWHGAWGSDYHGNSGTLQLRYRW